MKEAPELPTRTERDMLGERELPAHAYFGIHTLRAVENFWITETPISSYPELIQSLCCIKQAAALANKELELLDQTRAEAIVSACKTLREGKHQDQFPVDVIQGGAGTSTNMNTNEVIANLGLEFLGRGKGDYAYLHPNEHVNLSQSTNDVYPTALKLTAYLGIMGLLETMHNLQSAFQTKAEEFQAILKMGRTQLQDAVPMTLGQEFGGYAETLGEDIERLEEASMLMREVNLGGTAIGTGINAHPDYSRLICQHLSKILGVELITAPNLVEATQDCGAFVQLSGVLKRIAIKLSKTCNDLRLLSSGPRAGLNEINLPPMQAGSSIMPGKVNPVMPEVVNQVAFEIIGNDVTISMAAESGQLQLNAFEPIIGHSLLKSITHLRNACAALAERCVLGITANRDILRSQVENSIGLATALNPYLGYESATEVAKVALRDNRRVYDLVLESGLLSKEQLDKILHPSVLTRPHKSPKHH